MSKISKVKTTVNLPKWTHAYLKRHAKRTGRSLSKVYCSLLSDWVLDRMEAEEKAEKLDKLDHIKNNT